ncbi:MAG: PAAR-like domain-containing protein, partial [Myxococcota bacterium]
KRSSLDQPGLNKGVVSNKTSDMVQFAGYSPNVYFENKKAVPHLCTTKHNGKNANQPVGTLAVPSQSAVFITS